MSNQEHPGLQAINLTLKDRPVKYKDQHAVVPYLKNILRAIGYNLRPVREDYFDASMRDAIHQFQAAQGLDKSDVLDPATLEALAEVYQERLREGYVVRGMIRDAACRPGSRHNEHISIYKFPITS